MILPHADLIVVGLLAVFAAVFFLRIGVRMAKRHAQRQWRERGRDTEE